ncbi:MAG: pantoate--beta-alanine ligase [Candidatus Aminicenantes bacterium]|nr:pantoate--beta-alanine ligase [Candidatus Aminicenantes bacterium]
MRVVTGIPEMKALAGEWKAAGRTIGFVPTMGYLHEGHLSLVRASKERCEATVVSIFVNPAQFGPSEDFQRYPRDLAKDSATLEREGVDVLFVPAAEAVYPPGYKTYVEVRDLQDRLCGRTRPGHFRGVATIVLKLFNIVRPDVAFFGAKDAQQTVTIEKMARDLDLDVEIAVCPVVREPDGLAMSSRNVYLSPDERAAARVLSKSLAEAERLIREGERDASRVAARVKDIIAGEPLARLDYAEIVEAGTLEPVAEVRGDTLILLAVYIGRTRLIDNLRARVEEISSC